jgi:hypothetical protein
MDANDRSRRRRHFEAEAVAACRGLGGRHRAGSADQCEFAATLDQGSGEQERTGDEHESVVAGEATGVPAGGDHGLQAGRRAAAPDPSSGAQEKPAGHGRVADDGLRIV